MRRVWLWWSSGKDSAWSLDSLRQQSDFDVTAIVTTVNERFDRIAMHAVRRELLLEQASSVGLELRCVPIPHPCSNADYESAFLAVVDEAVRRGVEYMAFGDLFLRDVRAYRERLLEGTGIEPVFPLWGRDTETLSQEMLEGGLRAIVTCVDPGVLPREFAGREFDASLLSSLPPGVDPCGENGEFHTFAWSGPMFSTPIDCMVGEIVERDGFAFADVLRRK